MPFLWEVLNEIGNQTTYEIELKAFGNEFVDAVVEAVQKADLLSHVEFTSFQYPLLSYIKKRVPAAKVGFIAPRIQEWMDEEVAREFIKSHLLLGEIDVIHCPVKFYDRQLVDALRAMGLQIHFGLCDTEEELEKAIKLGADQLTTNDIELAVQVVKNSETNK